MSSLQKTNTQMHFCVRVSEMVHVNILLVLMAFLLAPSSAGNFYQEVNPNGGGPRAQIQNGGQVLTLSLDYTSGSGFESYGEFLYGRFDVQMKLIPGNSAGTVTTFYLSSLGEKHDEIDFEFLGNSTGEPYTIHTNVYTQGVGNKEQQFKPWFDPTADFHTYTIIWNPRRIIFMVDNMPIRVFNNYQSSNGIAFPTDQPMKVYGSLWNAENWATQGGRVKTDWSNTPNFVATYQNYCVASWSGDSCGRNWTNPGWQTQGLDDNQRTQMQLIQTNSMIYNYCTDYARYPQPPTECYLSMS